MKITIKDSFSKCEQIFRKLQSFFETKYSRMDEVKLWKTAFEKFEGV